MKMAGSDGGNVGRRRQLAPTTKTMPDIPTVEVKWESRWTGEATKEGSNDLGWYGRWKIMRLLVAG